MAIRMQQRRATGEQWTLANPVLGAGEIGFETDTSSFKIGDGVNNWSSLDYFTAADLSAYYTSTETDSAISSAVSALIDAAPGTLDTLNELAAALGDNPNFLSDIATDISDAEARANSYTDDEISAIPDVDLTPYSTTAQADAAYDVKGAAAAAETAAKEYADDKDVALSEVLVAAFQSYTNSATENMATEGYVDTQDGITLEAANAYAELLAGNYDAAGSAAIAETDANDYTDGKISALDTSLKSYADTAEADAKTYADELVVNYAPLAGAAFTGAVTLHADPTQALQAATKEYVDNIASGIIAKPSVLGATSTNIDATYNNGTAGVGATLTHSTNGVFPVSTGGATGWEVGSGILVKDQTNKAENGRYVIIDLGSASTSYVLRRCSLCDTAEEIPGAYIFVQDGTFKGTGWIQVVTNPSTFVVGTDDISVIQFSGAGTYTAGNGLELNGNQFVIDSTITATKSDLTTKQDVVSGVSDTEIGYLDGVTSGIQGQIDGKSNTSHTHTAANITDFSINSPANGSILMYNGSTSKWENSVTIDGGNA